MTDIPWILIALAAGLLVALLAVFVSKKQRKENCKTDYRTFYILGLVWTIIGLPLFFADGNAGFFAMGVVFLVIGLANKDKWEETSGPVLTEKKRGLLFGALLGGLLALTIVLYAGWHIRSSEPEVMQIPASWVQSTPDAQGLTFRYPTELGTTYISTAVWPPVVSREPAGEYICPTENETTINGHQYCLTTTSEGAAGSVYTTYEYTLWQGEYLLHVELSLRYPQCRNYDEPKQSDCIAEQDSFDVGNLADMILGSVSL